MPSVVMLNVTYKPYVLSVFMLSVVMLNVVLLSVGEPIILLHWCLNHAIQCVIRLSAI
jgi:hypothetical protein